MAIQTQTITTTPLTADEHVAQINAATANITRASSVAAAARPIVAGEITVSELASGASKGNLDAMGDTARGYIRTLPLTGEFPVTAVQRNAAGEVDVEYDDVAIV